MGTEKELILKYTGQKTYLLQLGKLSRELPIIKVTNNTRIAFFESLGDVDLINQSAKELAKHLKECEILVTSESKGIALAHQIAALLGHTNFIVLRKERKAYMKDPLVQTYHPITSEKEKQLYLDSSYAPILKGKKVGIVDDVISSRATLDAIGAIVEKAGGIVVKKAVMLSEGREQSDVISLGILPLFKE